MSWRVARSTILLALFVLCPLRPPAAADRPLPAIAAGRVASDETATENSEQDESDADPYQHASLQTDPEIQTFLQRARTYAESEQYDTAARLLQKVLDDGSRVMVRAGRRTYRPATLAAHQLLIGLPREALETYRILADAGAAAMMEPSGARRDTEVLQEVVRRYFLSSYGDDAAYRLACLYINAYQFSRARRLLTDVLRYHRQPSVSEEDVLLRLAFVETRLGDRAGAKKRWQQFLDLAGEAPLPPDLKSVRQAVAGTVPTAPHPETTREIWHLPRGTPGHDGRMPLPAGLSETDQPGGWASIWERSVTATDAKDSAARGLLSQIWIEEDLRPTNQILFGPDRLWASSPRGLACYEKTTGQRIWSQKGSAPFTGVEPNQQRLIIHHRVRQYDFRKIAYFQDRLDGSISLHGNTLFRIEGNWETVPRRRRVKQGKRFTYVYERGGSRLVAYDARTGSRRWMVGGGKVGSEEFLAGGRFMNAPVPAAGHVLLTLEKDDGLYLLALDPTDGNVLWQEFLCAYVSSPLPPWSPVGLSVDAGEAYVATGNGVVFAVDAGDGHVYWAAVYRSETQAWENVNPFGRRPQKEEKEADRGWAQNVIFPRGRNLIVLPADAPRILCLDRTTGELRYRRPSQGARYAAGLAEDGLVASDNESVHLYDIETGRVRWSRTVLHPTGRPLLAGQRVLVPQAASITVLDARSGQPQKDLHVGLTQPIPLGNLYSDGDRLYSTGMMRVAAISSGRRLLADLNEKVRQHGNAGAYLDRGRFFLKTARYNDSVEDLRKAYSMAQEDPRTARFDQLTAEMTKVRREKDQIHSRLAWFADRFDRQELGPNYKVISGNARIQDGAVRMWGENAQQLLQLTKQIPGNFEAQITGWQNERPCDLSFKLDIKGPGGRTSGIYAQFGANWNVRNLLQIDGRQIESNRNYLIEIGKKHNVRLVRVGSRLTLYADDRKILDQPGVGPDSQDTKTTLAIYGFGTEHFFDNLAIRRLDTEGRPLGVSADDASDAPGERELKQRLEHFRQRENDIEKEHRALRREGYVAVESVREVLFRGLLQLAKQPDTDSEALLARAAEVTRTPEENARLHITSAEAARNRGDMAATARHFFQMARHSDSSLLQIDPTKPALRVSAACWARRQIQQLRHSGGETIESVIQPAATRHLDRLLAREDVPFEELYRVMQIYTGSEAGIRAGLSAASRAEQAEKKAQAELILIQMQQTEDKQTSAAGMAALAGLYEKRRWHATASRTWRALRERHPDVPITEGGSTLPAAQVAEQALGALAEHTGTDPDRPAGMPNPPYRLLWKDSVPGYLLRRRLDAQFSSKLLDNHVFLLDHSHKQLICRDVHSGEIRWKRSFQRRGQMGELGHVVFNSYPLPQAISLLGGRTLWKQNLGQVDLRTGGNRISVGSGMVVVQGSASTGTHAVYGLDAVTGQVQWRRQILQQRRPHLLVLGGYVFDLSHGGYRGPSMTARVYDVHSGDLITTKFPRPQGRQFWTLNGHVAQEGEKYVLRTLPHGDKAWELPLAGGNQTYIRPVKNSPLGLYMGPKKLALIDPLEKKILWSMPNESKHRVYVSQAVYDPDRDEICLIRRTRHGKQQRNTVMTVETRSGKLRDKTTLPNNMQIYHRGSLPANDTYLAALETTRQKIKGKNVHLRRYRLIRREDDKMLPGVRLPHLKDLSEREKRHSFNLHVVGDTLVFVGGGKVLVYAHDPDRELQ